jgi:vancomycin resistance protein YoaR
METFQHTDEQASAKHTPLTSKGRRVFRIIGGTAALIVVIALIPTSIAIGYDQYFANKIFPSVRVFDVSLSGMTKEEATLALQRETNNLLDNGVTFTLNGARYTISKTSIDAKQMIRFSIEDAVEKAYAIGRSGDLVGQTTDRYKTILAGSHVELPIDIDEQTFAELLATHFAADIKPSIDATPQVKIDPLGEISSIGVSTASSGSNPRFLEAVHAIRTHLAENENPSIAITVDITEPNIRATDAEPHLAELSTLLGPREIRLVHEKGSWPLTRKDIAGALTFIQTKDGLQAGIDVKKLAPYFKPIRKIIEVPAVNAIFTMKEDKVVEFVPHKTGIGIDDDALASDLRDALYQAKAGIELPMKVTEPEITNEKSNSLGINEALGTGTSSFARSPKNRIANITNGASKLNLTLIAPDEEFSLVSQLKPFDEENGYAKELVIKGNKIEPEIGGGLCQIGTTTFRSVMNSGLPITMRQNHTLVVSYYNDPANGLPGSDATIYDPNPDFRFVNDTGHYILFLAQVLPKQKLAFTIYGTSDGRKGSYEPPEVSKWTPVPKDAKKLFLESDTVKPGKQSCEPGFPGAIASLKYTIEKADGTKTDRIFTSIYRMLPPVCLVAKGEIPQVDPATAPTSPGNVTPIPAVDAGEAAQ